MKGNVSPSLQAPAAFSATPSAGSNAARNACYMSVRFAPLRHFQYKINYNAEALSSSAGAPHYKMFAAKNGFQS